MSKWPRQRDVSSFFGPVGKNQTMLHPPFPMVLAWDTSVPVTRFSIHKKCHDSAMRVFNRIKAHYSPEDIVQHGFNLFGGCLNVRRMRGGRSYSMHSWGIAIDFDPARNRFRWGYDPVKDKHDEWGKNGKPYLARKECDPFWKFWEEEGWTSLGRSRNFDWMHVQAADL